MSSVTRLATKRSRASSAQLNRMIDYFTENPSLAIGRYLKLHGKLKCRQKWSEIATMLNGLEGPEKTVEQWQTVWRDLKSRTSVRVRERKRQQQDLSRKRGETPITFTKWEKRLIALLHGHYNENEDLKKSILDEEEIQIPQEDEEETYHRLMEDVESDTGDHFVALMSQDKLEANDDTQNPHKQTPRHNDKLEANDTENPQMQAPRNQFESSDLNAKFLKIVEQQSDTLKILAESSSSNAEAIRSVAEATRSMSEIIKTIADSFKT